MMTGLKNANDEELLGSGNNRSPPHHAPSAPKTRTKPPTTPPPLEKSMIGGGVLHGGPPLPSSLSSFVFFRFLQKQGLEPEAIQQMMASGSTVSFEFCLEREKMMTTMNE